MGGIIAQRGKTDSNNLARMFSTDNKYVEVNLEIIVVFIIYSNMTTEGGENHQR